MYKISYKIRPSFDKRYAVTCETIEQAIRLASDFLMCGYEILTIRKV